MIPILIGTAALVALLLMLRAFVGADPKLLVKSLRYVGAGLLGLLAVGLFLTERIGGAVFVASMAWGLFTNGRLWPGGWPHYSFPGTRSAPSDGQTSRVRTAWVEMELDHDSGDMRGTILQGAYAGRLLSDLDRNALLAFCAEANADPDSKRLLEAYLDRTFGPDWRQKEEPRREEPPPRGRAGMSRAEALIVLGLDEGASDDEIRDAHRRLMKMYHPDLGGSDYLAAKVNEAKDVLLG